MKKLRPKSFLLRGSQDRSVVVGAPPGFDFLASLRNASSIKASVAFGHMSGWDLIKATLVNSRAKGIQVLLGQSFLQTEPNVLDSLRECKPGRIRGKLAAALTTFHPKVWIVDAPDGAFAIVGSANLSKGGFSKNIECSAYVAGDDALKELDNWFAACWRSGSPLRSELCATYRAMYKRASAARAAAKKAIQEATDELADLEVSWRRQDAVEAARRFFASEPGREAQRKRTEAMEKITKCLKPRQFQFSKDDWHCFLKIPEFGNMKRIRRDTDRRLPQIRKAFLHLANKTVPLADRVDSIVPTGGRYHVPGIGLNIATKVLAMLDRRECAVYNVRVAKTLKAFGYKTERGATMGTHYAQFCKDTKSFVRDCGLSDMLSLDPFFLNY